MFSIWDCCSLDLTPLMRWWLPWLGSSSYWLLLIILLSSKQSIKHFSHRHILSSNIDLLIVCQVAILLADLIFPLLFVDYWQDIRSKLEPQGRNGPRKHIFDITWYLKFPTFKTPAFDFVLKSSRPPLSCLTLCNDWGVMWILCPLIVRGRLKGILFQNYFFFFIQTSYFG